MKKIIVVALITFCVGFISAQERFKCPKNFKYPKIKRSAIKELDFVPKNWKILSKVYGDLNKDKKADVVLVIQANYAELIEKNVRFEGDSFNTNPRMLLILFKQKNGYRLAEKSNTFVPISDYPAMLEPFQKVSIRKNVITFYLEIFLSAGGWSASNHQYKFRFQNGKFILIGADKYGYVRNSGETKTRSYNFLTKKVKIVEGNYSTDKKSKTIWRKFNFGRYRTFQNFKPFEWQIEPGYYI